MSKIEVNAVEPQCGTTLTVGANGDTVSLPSGTTLSSAGTVNFSSATQTGVGRQGTVDWDTTAKTAAFTAVSGNGYFVNTTSGAITVTLPASPSAGDIVAVADYAGTAATNNITIARNGSNIEGGTENAAIFENRDASTFVYVDATQGWVPVNNNEKSGIIPPLFITATGGNSVANSPCGNYKIHTFTGPGTFCVSCAGNVQGNNQLEYIVVAGGGGGGGGDGTHGGGGGGAGGFRFAAPSLAPLTYPAKPLAGSTLTASVSPYPITVGGGASGTPPSTPSLPLRGSSSVFSTITSTGGGNGANDNSSAAADQANSGGSGGGAGADSGGGNTPNQPKGAGNTPPVSPPQGNPGEVSNQSGYGGAGGGGGATAPGEKGGPPDQPYGTGGDGGTGGGFPNAFGTSGQNCGSFYYFSGGGGGGPHRGQSTSDVPGGVGGGGTAGGNGSGTAGTANTGGGGGARSPSGSGNAGGSGIVIIRYKFQ
jgi:hypothetical protein